MRVLLSTIGSRGDVQPLVALGMELRALGQEVRLCVPPDFRGWIEGLGMPVTPIGPELRPTGKANPGAALPTPEQRRRMVEGTVAAQFETIGAAARGCDVIVGATALQIAAPSVAESLGIPYVFAAYCPAVLPSPHHAPPVLAMRGERRLRPWRTNPTSGRRIAALEPAVGAPAELAPGGPRPGAGRGRASATSSPTGPGSPPTHAGALARSRGTRRVPDRRLDPAG